ncbi:MAG: serine/threonine-protein kinase, partial [Thermoanaerobaculia bacterium]
MIIEPGSRLGPYEISEPLGQGGMGQVYRARDTRLGRGVAIKVIQSEVAGDAEHFARFQREARLSSSLNHPNIVTIYDFANADGTAFIAMELVAGQSIRGLLSGSPLSLREALPIATQIAAGLAAAHRAGIVHRDLKPENVMITPQGAVKILDFGLAKTVQAQSDPNAATEQHLTTGHRVMGTTAYMSPEQARGAQIDFRSDQFSFGVMLYEMLTGRHPFARPTVMETLVAINRDGARPLAEVQPDLPETLIWIVDRCLEKNPERRYGSTDDLAIDLARVPERSGNVRAVQGRPARSFAWPVAIGALALAAL